MDRFFIIGTDERIVIIRYISIIKFVFQQKFPLFVRGRITSSHVHIPPLCKRKHFYSRQKYNFPTNYSNQKSSNIQFSWLPIRGYAF